MKNHNLRFLACTIVFAFILQPIPTFANTSQIAISDSAPMVFTQTIAPLGPDHEIEDRQFELELEAERQPIGEEHVREEGFPDELLNHKHGYNPQEKREYFLSKPYNLEKVAQQVQEFDCSLVTDVSQSECEALLVIYEQTIAGGDGSHTWLSTYTIGDWIGVTVTGGHVVGLDLAIDGKIWPHGMLTPEIADLSFLVSLDICGGYWDRIVMSGGIPPEMGNLSNLEHLNLCYISLSGFIPAELGNLSSLKSLYLIYLDDLEGNIPSELGNLNNLETLVLDFDYGLEGNLPASFGNLVNLKRLSLNNLNLTGCIPAELGKLTNLLYLNLVLNDFSCEIPPEFGGMSNLKDLNLRKNYNLSGDLPPELGNLTNLTSIQISFTNLSGSIPLSFVNLTKLENMNFDETKLCEPVTSEFLAWKATVYNWEGTGLICEIEEVNINFNPNPDGYQFENWGSISPGDYTIGDMRIMFGDEAVCWKTISSKCIPNKQAMEFNSIVNLGMFGGHCMGMSTTSLRFFRGLDDHNGFSHTYDLEKGSTVQVNWSTDSFSTSARRNISYFHVLQTTNPIDKIRQESLSITPFETLLNLSEAMNSGGEDYILIVRKVNNKGGHVVTPYAIEKKENNEYWIKVYDNNHPNDSNRHVVINIYDNTWSYDAGEGLGVYSGDAESHTLGIVPVSLFNQRPECPWCESELQAIASQQLWYQGAGDLLITDSEMRRLGYQDGVYYNEIPDAYGSPILGGLGIETEPVYSLPLTDEYTITLQGSLIESTEKSSLTAFGPGYTVLLDDVSLNANTNDMLTISNDGTLVSYQANQPQIATLGLILNTEDANWQLETKQLEMTAGEVKTLTADTPNKILELNSNQSSSGSYDIFFTRIGDDSINSFYNTGLIVESGATHYLHFDGWQNTGTVQLDIDKDGDGNPDETLYLENQLKMLYLPILWR